MPRHQKSKTFKIVSFLATTLLAISLIWLIRSNLQEQQTVIINDTTFKVEVVDTPEKIQIGLMNRRNLPTQTGMLFKFNEGQTRTFWMKNTYIPLDIIFIDANKQIVNIAKDFQPCQKIDPSQQNCPTTSSLAPAKYVLEINAGESKTYNLKPGDLVEID
jgi:uncharacterized membrane protein (UPF0127 family)